MAVDIEVERVLVLLAKSALRLRIIKQKVIELGIDDTTPGSGTVTDLLDLLETDLEALFAIVRP